MLKVEKYVLTDDEKNKLKDAASISCVNLTHHNCNCCPLSVNVYDGYPHEPVMRCLLSLIDQSISLSSDSRWEEGEA